MRRSSMETRTTPKRHEQDGAPAAAIWGRILAPLCDAVDVRLWLRDAAIIRQMVEQLMTDGVLPRDVKFHFHRGGGIRADVGTKAEPDTPPSRIIVRLEIPIELTPTAGVGERRPTKRAPRAKA
jgi:hypothetical protein